MTIREAVPYERSGRFGLVSGSPINAVRIERAAHPVPTDHVSADQRHCVVRDRIELPTFRFSGGLSSAREPLLNAAPQPALPAEGPLRSSWQQFSRRADVCRIMSFRPCYTCVGTLPDPDLCYSCVSPQQPPFSRRAYAADRRACLRPEDRPAPATAHPAALPPEPGIARRDDRNVRRWTKPRISPTMRG
jgi:hypothetical protein